MCNEGNLNCWVLLTFLGAIVFSLGVSVPMFILVYPGDECLLFVSVRGEALIYGHPAGCNFIAYGHCIIILAGTIVWVKLCPRRDHDINNKDYLPIWLD